MSGASWFDPFDLNPSVCAIYEYLLYHTWLALEFCVILYCILIEQRRYRFFLLFPSSWRQYFYCLDDYWFGSSNCRACRSDSTFSVACSIRKRSSFFTCWFSTCPIVSMICATSPECLSAEWSSPAWISSRSLEQLEVLQHASSMPSWKSSRSFRMVCVHSRAEPWALRWSFTNNSSDMAPCPAFKQPPRGLFFIKCLILL